MSRTMRFSVSVAAAAALMAGCSFQAGMNPTYFNPSPRNYDEKIAGIGAIEMPRAVQDETFSGKPTSFTGGGTNLTLPLGAISREAANLAFRDVFAGGAKVVESANSGPRYSAVVKPRITRFSYEYNQLKNVGFAITPTTTMSLSVTLADTDGKQMWEKTFDSVNFEGETYFVSGSPGEEISKTAHKALMKLMQEAADAVQKDLRASPAALPKGEKSL